MNIILTILPKVSDSIKSIARFIILVAFSLHASHASQSGNEIVLITGSKSDISSISIIEVRRLYLGLPPVNNREAGKAVINMSSHDIFNMFLKNVMHMTESRYRRRLVKRVFRYGTSHIKEANSLTELSDHFKNNKNDITFIERSSLDQMDNVKVLTRLW